METGTLCISDFLAEAMKAGRSSSVRAYTLAIFFCLVAGALGWVLDAPSSCFMLALIATSLFGGRGPAFLTIFLSSCAFEFVFLPPAFHLLHSRPSLVRMGFFVAVMLVSEAILHAKRRSDKERLAIGEDFRSLAETSPDAIFMAGPDKKLLFANSAMLTMFRRPPWQVLGASTEELLPGFHTLEASGEFAAVDADGIQLYVEATCGRFGNKTTVFLRDISDRKAAEEKLQKSEQSLRLTLETIPGLVYTCTPEGAIDYGNEQISAYLDMTLPEIRQGGWDEALHPEDRARVIEQRQASFLAGVAHTMEYRLRRFDGNFRSFQTSVRPLTDERGQIIRWYGVLTDIEERRQAEDSLRRTETKLAKAAQSSAISELAAAVVHEISQPLSAMVANGQACLRWLASTPPNTEDGRASVERIVRDGKDATEIVRGLRSLFRNSALEKTKLDMRVILSEVASVLRGRLERERIRLEIDLPSDLPAIEGDKTQLQQVMMNLLGNAVDALKDKEGSRRIEARSRRQGTMILTEVLDNGASPADFTAIFDPFVTTKSDGMGMGLAICRSIIKAHDGQLWGAARVEGGTVFSFTLPCLAEDRYGS